MPTGDHRAVPSSNLQQPSGSTTSVSGRAGKPDRRLRLWIALVATAASAGTVPLLVLTTVPGWSFTVVGIVLLSLATGVLVRRLGDSERTIPGLLFAGGAAVATISVLTGALNGLSDEPYTTPAYAALGFGLYIHPIAITYLQYGVVHSETSFDVYLPLLAFIQVPGLDYRWVSTLAWGGMVLWLRGDPRAATTLSMAWVPLLAANGQNDFVPLLAVSLAIARSATPGARWVEVVALGLKQLANVVVFVYHLARREYRWAAASVIVTAMFLLPFAWIDPSSVYCHVLLADPGTSCAPRGPSFFAFKRNFWLYPMWAVAVYYAPIMAWVRRQWLARVCR